MRREREGRKEREREREEKRGREREEKKRDRLRDSVNDFELMKTIIVPQTSNK